VKHDGRGDEYFYKDEGSEDSDWEQTGHSVTEAEVGSKESGQDSLPILSIGSFAR
jgi:hypothetical protein